MKSFSMNIRPSGDYCNIWCAYCDAEHRCTNVPDFNISRFEEELDKIKRQGYDSGSFILHGGEPLTAPFARLIEVVDLCQSYFGGVMRIQLQTNGTLLNADIAEQFRLRGVSISVSLDPQLGNLRYKQNVREGIMHTLRTLVEQGHRIGVISVAHALNIRGFADMLDELIFAGVPYWSINKIRCRSHSPLAISEQEYSTLLLNILHRWVARYPHSIEIQPLVDFLLAQGGHHICKYSPQEDKCSHFFVFDGDALIPRCEHAKRVELPHEECRTCEAFDFCGGGCPYEDRDDTFCAARRGLKKAITSFLSSTLL